MAAYRRVHGFGHLWADCWGLGSAPELDARFEYGTILTFTFKDDTGGDNNCSCKTCKAPVKSLPSTNQHPTFYRPDALLIAQSTASQHWKAKTDHTAIHLVFAMLCMSPVKSNADWHNRTFAHQMSCPKPNDSHSAEDIKVRGNQSFTHVPYYQLTCHNHHRHRHHVDVGHLHQNAGFSYKWHKTFSIAAYFHHLHKADHITNRCREFTLIRKR